MALQHGLLVSHSFCLSTNVLLPNVKCKLFLPLFSPSKILFCCYLEQKISWLKPLMKYLALKNSAEYVNNDIGRRREWRQSKAEICLKVCSICHVKKESVPSPAGWNILTKCCRSGQKQGSLHLEL